MTDDRDQNLYQEWEERWEGSEQAERLTLLGKQMFRAKKQVIGKALQGLDVQTVLEAGCGLGHTLQVYQQLGLQASGIDISPSAVAVCCKKGLQAEVKALSDVGQQYDLVSSDGMLEHFLHFEPHAVEIMQASRRYVLLIQPNHGSFVGKTLAYLAELLRGDENVFEYNYRIKDFVEVFAKNGFVLQQSLPIFMDVFRLLLFERQQAETTG
jgi:2-polyprenyl-3-methyl-5-hydroxy-6-metoxy-1,4-benzoquinol methylase